VLAAGISSGAGLAAILGVRFPGLLRGVVAHSGIACVPRRRRSPRSP